MVTVALFVQGAGGTCFASKSAEYRFCVRVISCDTMKAIFVREYR
jgi:hypothetical protein